MSQIIIFFVASVLLVIAGVADAIRDVLDHRFEESKFKNLNPRFWNRILSGENKWKDGKRENGERFFLSSSLLVFTTEAWHLFKMIYIVSFSVAFMLIGTQCNNIWMLFLLWVAARFVVFGLVFTFVYKYLKNESLFPKRKKG
jgi:hypothetical protein